MNTLEFSFNKGGNTIKKELIVVENETTKELKVILSQVGDNKSLSSLNKDASNKRIISSECDDFNTINANWKKKGIAVIDICVNEDGMVVTAINNRKKTTITDQKLLDLIVNCVKNYRYESVPNSPIQCGEIKIVLGFQ